MVRGAAVCVCLVALMGGGAGARPEPRRERALDLATRRLAARRRRRSERRYAHWARIDHGLLPRPRPDRRPRGSRSAPAWKLARLGGAETPYDGSDRLLPAARLPDDRGRTVSRNERDNCRASTQAVQIIDRTPPTFAGLQRATTCIPGPVGGGTRSSLYSLRWVAATDDVTPSSASCCFRTRSRRRGRASPAGSGTGRATARRRGRSR
jgi:hypothetical protein